MSLKGINSFAQILSDAQQLRQSLLNRAVPNGKGLIDHQDVALATLCRELNDAVKDGFMRATVMDPKTGEHKAWNPPKRR